MRGLDWTQTGLGAPERWPAALKTVVGLMLGSKFPMFIAWGRELNFLYNDAYIDVLGAKHPSAMGRPFAAVWAEIWDEVRPLIDRALQGDATYHENLPLRMRRRGYDEQTWFTFSYSPLRDDADRIVGVYCACTETTATVLSATHRAEELERLRLMFEQAPGMMAVARGPDHVLELANRAYMQIIGHRNVLGRTVRDALPEIVEQGFVELLDRVYQTGEPYIGSAVPIRLQKRPGAPLEEHVVDFIYQPIRDACGTVSGIFLQGTDVTDRTRAMRELQASDRRKDEFLAMLAHELRNPLSPIRSAAELLRHHRLDEAGIRQASDIIVRQVAHMTELVDDLLDVSRVTRGTISLEFAPLDVAAVVANAIEQVRTQLQAHRHRLTVHNPRSPVHVQGDPTRLVQVLGNLLGNAIKYTPDGGAIELAFDRDGDDVVISVRDDGIGIDADLLPHVFDLFTQAERKADRSQGGLGLGLALVKRLVDLHGGQVAARSDGIGRGSEFVVRLPRIEVTDEPAPLADASDRRALAVHRILVVDDNRDAAESLGLLLQLQGHAVTLAHDAATALQAAGREHPDVMILDIGLPDLDGYALARQLRARPDTAGARLIALTGYGRDVDHESSHAAGFDHHLVKPLDIDRLLELLDKPC